MKCDVLVVGAGPSGAMAAKTAAEKGSDVVMIDRKHHIGSPVRCGEGINKFLFNDTGISKKKSFIEREITDTKIYFYDEVYSLQSELWQGYTVDRTIFDEHLACRAAEEGALLLRNTKATGLKRKGGKWLVTLNSQENLAEIEADIVIGADGFACNVGRWAGITNKWQPHEFCKCIEYLIECSNLNQKNTFHIAFGEEFPSGYGWIFPKQQTANVGVSVAPYANTKEALHFFLKHYPIASSLLGDNISIIEKRGGCYPATGPRSPDKIVGDGVMLVGDAAGMVEPISGEGIAPSMISGIAAGETAAKAIKNGKYGKKNLSAYPDSCMQKQYMGMTLGENMEALKKLYEPFVHAFSEKDVDRTMRGKMIAHLEP